MQRKSMKNSIISMKISRKGLAVFMALMLLGGMLAGCGGESVTPSPSPAMTPESVSSDGNPISGGSFTMVMPQNPSTMNPFEPGTREMVDLYGLIFDGLIRFDDTLKPIPGLAESWTVDESGLVWTFKLKSDVTFHDGSKMTSQDVVSSLNILKSYYSDSQKDSIYEGVFQYIKEYSAPDETTLTITATQKGHRLLDNLYFPIVPHGYSANSTSLPQGTGAYRVESYEQGKQMVLQANDSWWRRTPYISTITVMAMPDTETALTSLNVNKVDVVHSTSLTASRYRQENVRNILELNSQEFECIIPNTRRAKLGDARMRKAIAYAIDRKEMITDAYISHAVSVDVPIPPDSYLFDQNHTQYEYNTGQAEQLLSQLGYQDANNDGMLDGLSLNVIVNENPTMGARADAARIAVNNLQEVGISATLTILSQSDYEKALKNGDFDLAFVGFNIGMDFDLTNYLHSSNAAHNYGRYSSSRLDQLLEQCGSAITEQETKDAYSDLQQFLSDEVPIICLYFRTNSLLYSANIKGVKSARDMAVFKSIEQWYILEEGDEEKAASSQE